MHTRTILVASLMAMSVAAAGRAQTEPRRVSLADALVLFAQHSLELRMARADAARQSGTVRQAAAYSNPVLSASRESLASGSIRYHETYLNVTQRLDQTEHQKSIIGIQRVLLITDRFILAVIIVVFSLRTGSLLLRSGSENKRTVIPIFLMAIIFTELETQ